MVEMVTCQYMYMFVNWLGVCVCVCVGGGGGGGGASLLCSDIGQWEKILHMQSSIHSLAEILLQNGSKPKSFFFDRKNIKNIILW